MSGDPDPLSSTIRGVVAGAVDSVPAKIHKLALLILERKTAFVKDPLALAAVRESRKLQEYRIYKQFVKDQRLLTLIRLGLALKKLEGEEGYQERVARMRQSILNKFGTPGLRAAEVVESGALREFLGELVSRSTSPADVENGLTKLLDGVEKWTFFVQGKHAVAPLAKELYHRILANQPGVFIIFAHGTARVGARRLEEATIKSLGAQYGSEERQVGDCLMFFIGKKVAGKVEIRAPV